MGIVDLTDRIRRRAYEIWETEGCPHGRHVTHWLRAESEIREPGQEPRVPEKRTRKNRKAAALSRQASKSSRKQRPKT